MKKDAYDTPAAFRQALEARLGDLAGSKGVDVQRLRKQTAFDRLLCRLLMLHWLSHTHRLRISLHHTHIALRLLHSLSHAHRLLLCCLRLLSHRLSSAHRHIMC